MASATVAKLPSRAQPRPVAQVERITPKLAEEYLATMVANRAPSATRVLEFAIDMEAGKWVINAETLKFNDKGNLIDGQHRLHACIMARTHFDTYVIRGVDDPRAFATIDVGKTRTHGDIFSIVGIKDPNVASGAATIIYYLKNGVLTNVNGPRGGRDREKIKRLMKGTKFEGAVGHGAGHIAKETLLEFAGPYQHKIADAISKVSSLKVGRVITKTQAVALYILFSDKDPAAAYDFMRDLATGTNLGPRDPVHVLREKLLDSRSATTRLTRWAVLLLIIKAWNARRGGEKVGFYRLSENESFPKIR